MKKQASALLVVMVVMTGFTVLLTSWWQMVGWSGDLALVRQRYVTQFYATELVRNLVVAWVKKSFDNVIGQHRKTRRPVTVDGGVMSLDAHTNGRFSIVIDQAPGDDHYNMVRVMVSMTIDGQVVTCHRCLVEQKMMRGAPQYMAHHVAFR